MRNWFLPAAVLGLSGLALVLTNEKRRERVRQFFEDLREHGDPFGEFNKFCEEQLEIIQQNLDRLSEALEGAQKAG